MSNRSSKCKGQSRDTVAQRRHVFRPLIWLIGGSTLFAMAFGVGFSWYQFFPPAPERAVDIYRTPGCTCDAGWIRTIESDGFVVRVTTTQRLADTRRALNMPPILRGCHIGLYLNYFLEGHVAPAAIRDLAIHRPVARGLVTQPALEAAESHSATTVDKSSPVILLGLDGRSRSLWYRGGS